MVRGETEDCNNKARVVKCIYHEGRKLWGNHVYKGKWELKLRQGYETILTIGYFNGKLILSLLYSTTFPSMNPIVIDQPPMPSV